MSLHLIHKLISLLKTIAFITHSFLQHFFILQALCCLIDEVLEIFNSENYKDDLAMFL